MTKEYKKFSDYTVAERVEVVRELMEADHSNKTAADILQTTKNTIAGFRRDHKIPSRHQPPNLRKKGELPPPTIIAIELPPEMGIISPEEEGGSEEVKKMPPLKLAVTEATQCIEVIPLGEKSFRCGFEREPESRYCRRHRSRAMKVK